MKVIDNIITDSINEKSQQVFTESDIIIFFNKDELIFYTFGLEFLYL